jgi:hypothetical protein
MSADKDVLSKEIGLWRDFVQLTRVRTFLQALFLVLLFEQQKMINELIQKFGKVDRI